MGSRKQIVFRLTKADEAKKQVWGVMASARPDKSGEVLDYATSKPFFLEWSGEIAKATGGKSLGNVREMHQSVAVGRVIALNCDDAQQLFEVGIQVDVDDAWRKVDLGVLTGLSIGGSYVKKWPDQAEPDLVRYTAKPAEVSLVDNPANPDAHFTMVRSDGRTEMIKATGAGPAQVWDCGAMPSAHAHAGKEEAAKCMKASQDQLATAPSPDDPSGTGIAVAPASAPHLPATESNDAGGSQPGAVHAKAAAKEALSKCLYCVANLAYLTGNAVSVEDALESEQSDLAPAMDAEVKRLHELLVQVAEEAATDDANAESYDQLAAALQPIVTKVAAMMKFSNPGDSPRGIEKGIEMEKPKGSETPATPAPAPAAEPAAAPAPAAAVASIETVSKSIEDLRTQQAEFQKGILEVLQQVVDTVTKPKAPGKAAPVLRVAKAADGDDAAPAGNPAKEPTSIDLMKAALSNPVALR